MTSLIYITIIGLYCINVLAFKILYNNKYKHSNLFALSRAIISSDGNEGKKSFDSDFAEAISKPLPKWYKDSLVEREKLMEEIKNNRERIIQEFKSKYIDISEEEKIAEKRKRDMNYKKRLEKRKSVSSGNWLSKVTQLGKKKDVLFSVDEDLDEDVDISTKEKWDLFWKDEEEQTGFNLPGFFEVFPELKFKWPQWARKNDGSVTRCETDTDCPVPAICCVHPILPGEKFCCTGWGRRIMVPAYALQEIQPDTSGAPSKSKGDKERENWRPDL